MLLGMGFVVPQVAHASSSTSLGHRVDSQNEWNALFSNSALNAVSKHESDPDGDSGATSFTYSYYAVGSDGFVYSIVITNDNILATGSDVHIAESGFRIHNPVITKLFQAGDQTIDSEGNEHITGDSTIDGSQSVGGDQTVTGDQTINGDSTVTNQTIEGNQIINNYQTVGSGEDGDGQKVDGDQVITGDQTVGGDSDVTGDPAIRPSMDIRLSKAGRTLRAIRTLTVTAITPAVST